MLQLKSENIVDLLLYRAINQTEQRAFTFLKDGETEAGSLTYQELDTQARAIAAAAPVLPSPGRKGIAYLPIWIRIYCRFFRMSIRRHHCCSCISTQAQ